MKRKPGENPVPIQVAPLAGAWIETTMQHQLLMPELVAPLAGAWIETKLILSNEFCRVSHPSRVRGLKLSMRDRSAIAT